MIVTKQIPAGTVAALAWNPGVDDENSDTGAALAEPANPHTASPPVNATTPATDTIRRARTLGLPVLAELARRYTDRMLTAATVTLECQRAG